VQRVLISPVTEQSKNERMKKLIFPLLVCAAFLEACAGGPTKDYYNPIIYDSHFKGQPSIEMVDNVKEAETNAVADGYTVIGRTIYGGKLPEAVELKAQARRVHANKVIYSVHYNPPQPGSWHFGFGSMGGGGGTDSGAYGVRIVFLGK